MPLPDTVDVLVIGAGPVGLSVAITLKQSGVNVAIVDAVLKKRDGGRAAVVHSRTLEVGGSIRRKKKDRSFN